MSLLSKLKKIRHTSFAELRTRGRQTVTAFGEQIKFANALPTDAAFRRQLDQRIFAKKQFCATTLLENFQTANRANFFRSFADPEIAAETFHKFFPDAAAQTVRQAEQIANGKFDLLGFEQLDFGSPIDWHLEPIAKKRSALKHWKQFDELDTAHTGDFKIVWELNRHQHFFRLGAAYWLGGDERFAQTFAAQLSGWMRDNPPKLGVNWISSLEIGLRAISWLWALEFFKFSQALTPDIFADALKFLLLHGRHIEQFLSTFYSPNTHLTGEALALYYLGSRLPELNCAKRWRALGKQILLDELERQIHADGVYFEQSTWYHRYTTDFYTHFLVLGELNNDFSSEERGKLTEKLQLALDFTMHSTRPDGCAPLVGDDDGGRMLPLGAPATAANDFRAGLATGAVLFERNDYKSVAQKAHEETFWLLGANGVEKFESLAAREPIENSRFFPRGGYLATRSDWSDNADFLLFDCGQHGAIGGGHAHADALAFELSIGGAPVLIDAGTYTYHESGELRDCFRATAAHNALTIDGKSSSAPSGKFAWKTVADAQVKTRVQHQRFDFIKAAHNGFAQTLEADDKISNEKIEHARAILFLRGDYTVLLDEIETADAHDYELNFHCAPGIKLEIRDSAAVCSPAKDESKSLKMCAFGAKSGAWRAAEDWIAPCYGKRVAAASAKFAWRGVGRQRILTFLLPAQNRRAKPFVRETVLRNGRAFIVESDDRQDWLICKNEAGENSFVENELFKSDFDLAWWRIDPKTDLLAEAILLGGKRFDFRRKEIFNAPRLLQFARARRDDGGLRLEMHEP